MVPGSAPQLLWLSTGHTMVLGSAPQLPWLSTGHSHGARICSSTAVALNWTQPWCQDLLLNCRGSQLDTAMVPGSAPQLPWPSTGHSHGAGTCSSTPVALNWTQPWCQDLLLNSCGSQLDTAMVPGPQLLFYLPILLSN